MSCTISCLLLPRFPWISSTLNYSPRRYKWPKKNIQYFRRSLTRYHMGRTRQMQRVSGCPVISEQNLNYLLETGNFMQKMRCHPQTLWSKFLAILQEEHAGIVRMKAVARIYVWCTGLDEQITQLGTSCAPCQSLRNLPKKEKDARCPVTEQPWYRLHTDSACSLQSRRSYWFLLMNTTSKRHEIFRLQQKT